MDNENIEKLIDKIMEMGPIGGGDDAYSNEPEVKRIAARTGATTGVPAAPAEPKQSYEDWVKSQPKSRVIGIH